MTTLRQSPSGPLVDLISSTSDVHNDSVVAGSDTSLALDVLETRMRVLEAYEVLETFQGGVAGNVTGADQVGNVGDHSWSFFGSSATRNLGRPNDAQSKLGRYTVSGGTSMRVGVMLGSSGTPARGIGLLATQINSIEWSGVCAASGGLNGQYRYGFGTSVSVASMGTDGIFFEGDDGIAGDTWRCIARKAGVPTLALTSVTWKPNGTYFKLGIFRLDDGRFRFDIDDVTVATLAANAIPTTRMVAACQCESTVNSGQSIVFDTCRLRYRRL